MNEIYEFEGTKYDVAPNRLEEFMVNFPNATKVDEPGKTIDPALENTGSGSDDGLLEYEFQTQGDKKAWGRSVDGGEMEVVDANEIPEDWFNDPKFKQVYEAENKVEKAEEPSVLSAIASSLGVSFVEFQKGNVSMKEAVSLGVFELANKVFGGDELFGGDDLTGTEKVGVTAAMKAMSGGGSDKFDPIIEKLEENIPEFETASITKDLEDGNYKQAGYRAVLGGFRSAPSLVMAGMGPGGLVALATSVAGNKFEEEFEADPEESTGKLLAASSVAGVTEATFELVTRRLLMTANLIKATGGATAAKEVIEGGAKEIIKKIGGATLAEGASESATELVSTTLADYAILGKEFNKEELYYAMGDGAIIGSMIGGSIQGVGSIKSTSNRAKERAEAILMPEDAKNAIKLDIESLNSLMKDLPKAEGEGKKAIEDEIDIIEQRVIKTKRDANTLVGNLEGENFTNYAKAIDNINKNKKILRDAKTESEKEIANKNLNALKTEATDILKDSQAKTAKVVTETVKEQIKEAGLEGQVTEMTSEEISNIEEKGFDSKTAAGEFGFIKQATDGSFEIILNKDKPMVGTAAHEFMHAVLFKTIGNNTEIQNNLGDALVEHTSKLGGETSILGERLSAYGKWDGDTFVRDANFGEETITIMSESIIDGSLKFEENFFTKIGDVVRRFSQNYLGKEITFDTGRDVYNFVKDYSKSIKDGKINKAILNVAKEGVKGKLAEGKVKPEATVQMSKDASDKVQSIYEEQGIAGAMDIIEQFKPIVSRITEKRREAPNFDKELLMSEIEIGERGIFDLISKYDPDSGVPLAAYINKFLPSRAIEASRRVLGEEFTEDVSERVDIAAEEVADVDVKAKPKKKKIILSDRLGVKGKVSKTIAKVLPGLNIESLSFKTLKNQLPEVVGELFGISPKKIISGANITKKELQSAQMFINKNADVLISMLPEGATAGGTATGVPQTLLKAFYTKTDRAKMAKTGTKAGLAIQVKNNINKTDFLETFGIIDGKPDRTDRNTSARVLALASQTGKMMTNQAVREQLLKQGTLEQTVQRIMDGKSEIMFSKSGQTPVKFSKNQVKKALADPAKMRSVIGKERDYWQKLFDKLDLDLKAIDWRKPGDVEEYKQFILDVVAPIFPYEFFMLPNTGTFYGVRGPKNYQLTRTKSEFAEILDGHIQRFAEKNNITFEDAKSQLFNIGLKDKDGNFISKPLTEQEVEHVLNSIKRVKYGNSKEKGVKQKLTDTKFKESSKKGTKIIWNIIEKVQQADKRTIRGFSAMMQSSSANMGHFMRTSATMEGANTLSSPNREEHSNPITGVSKWNQIHAVLGVLIDGGIYDKSMKNHIQISLPIFMDDRLKGTDADGNKYDYSEFPPGDVGLAVYKGEVHPFIRMYNPNVSSSFSIDSETLSKMSTKDVANGEHLTPGVNPNVLVGADGKTHAQSFGVDVDPKLLNVSPKDTKGFARKIQIIQAQQDLINRILMEKITGNKISASKIKSVLNSAINLKIKPQLKETKTLNKAIQFSRSSQNETKGITVLDFDDTLATSKSLVISTSPEGVVRKLTAEEFAQEGADLLDQGWTHDFSEFSKVVDGKVASLFKKAMKLQGKFGPENMFVLTARPADSAPAIFEFLKANGLNIPLKNITGLANSTSEAKALWIADKVGEGYNDFYFADDALQNVQAVKNMLDQFDVKSKVQQAKVKFSKSMNDKFNDILENVTGIEANKRFSIIKGRKRGESKGKFRVFIPPSHEDFVGLLYNFLGKGKEGNAHRDFFEQALIRPLNRANREYDTARQSVANDYKELNKQFEDVKEKLNKKTPDGDFTFQDAIRVYLWDKHGHKIPGLSETDQTKLAELVMSDPQLQAYAETLNVISKQETYVNPTDGWNGGDIRMDLDDATGRVGRKQFFTEFIENAEIIFSEENLNKIEAGYGKGVRESLEDMLYRIKTGRNRPSGQNEQVNKLMNYLNGSVGTVMFFNMRSALLQQMSIVNYINFADNNIFAAAKAFANQKQYWADFAFIFNSDMLKQRRGGIQTDVNGAELAASLRNSKDITRKLISKLLELGFLPTQIGDNIAIATGGAAYYRNRINKYIKQGMSKKEAETAAFTDFQDITQSTQQSARPDMVSKQQASVIGKVILNFQNVTSQFNRLGKKAFQDIYNRRITKPNTTQMQSDISNAARITYYFAIQNAIFYTLQTALFAMMFDDDEEDVNNLFIKKRERLINGSIDSVLRGTGLIGGVVATLKNVAIAFARQRDVRYNPDESAVGLEALNLSPVIGIKFRKIVNAEKTLNYNKKVIKEMETFDIDNPQWSAVTNYTEAFTNIPLNRLYNKTQNVRQALNNEHSAWERSLMFLGWSQYNLDLENKKMEEIKEKTKGKSKTSGPKERTARERKAKVR